MTDATVLVVDDAFDAREVLCFTLEREGYRVLEASTGEEALTLAATHRPGVILMDVQMPIMDGIEATQRLKRDRALRDIPVIAYTAFARDVPRELFSAVLPKPCSPDKVLRALATHRAPTLSTTRSTGARRTDAHAV